MTSYWQHCNMTVYSSWHYIHSHSIHTYTYVRRLLAITNIYLTYCSAVNVVSVVTLTLINVLNLNNWLGETETSLK